MDRYELAERRALDGEISILDYICEVTEEDAKNDETGLSTKCVEAVYWQTVRSAASEGKKLVAFGGSVPVEVIYALDCVPLYLDLIPLALTKSTKLTAKFIYDADVHINSALCSHSKSMLGAALSDNSGFAPDAFIYTPIACPSGSTALGSYKTESELPTFFFDPPPFCTERSMKLCAYQVLQLVDFLERISGKKLSLEALQQNMESVNESKRLLEKCAVMRKKKPCPMSSRIQEHGKLMPVLAPTKHMRELLNKEQSALEAFAEQGKSPCPNGEKHRVFIIQIPLWCSSEIKNWLETEYSAVTVMDGLGYEMGELYKETDTLEDCYFELSRVVFYPPFVHGASSNSRRLIELSKGVVRDYGADLCLFLGNVGCRHTWAISKMLTDTLRDEFGVSTLVSDVDSVDAKYKDAKQIKAQISEFMDNVIRRK